MTVTRRPRDSIIKAEVRRRAEGGGGGGWVEGGDSASATVDMRDEAVQIEAAAVHRSVCGCSLVKDQS